MDVRHTHTHTHHTYTHTQIIRERQVSITAAVSKWTLQEKCEDLKSANKFPSVFCLFLYIIKDAGARCRRGEVMSSRVPPVVCFQRFFSIKVQRFNVL